MTREAWGATRAVLSTCPDVLGGEVIVVTIMLLGFCNAPSIGGMVWDLTRAVGDYQACEAGPVLSTIFKWREGTKVRRKALCTIPPLPM